MDNLIPIIYVCLVIYAFKFNRKILSTSVVNCIFYTIVYSFSNLYYLFNYNVNEPFIFYAILLCLLACWMIALERFSKNSLCIIIIGLTALIPWVKTICLLTDSSSVFLDDYYSNLCYVSHILLIFSTFFKFRFKGNRRSNVFMEDNIINNFKLHSDTNFAHTLSKAHRDLQIRRLVRNVK